MDLSLRPGQPCQAWNLGMHVNVTLVTIHYEGQPLIKLMWGSGSFSNSITYA